MRFLRSLGSPRCPNTLAFAWMSCSLTQKSDESRLETVKDLVFQFTHHRILTLVFFIFFWLPKQKSLFGSLPLSRSKACPDDRQPGERLTRHGLPHAGARASLSSGFLVERRNAFAEFGFGWGFLRAAVITSSFLMFLVCFLGERNIRDPTRLLVRQSLVLHVPFSTMRLQESSLAQGDPGFG